MCSLRTADARGLVVSSTICRAGSFWEVYGDRVDIDTGRAEIRVLLALASER
jgi:hypothetical protein